MLVAKDGGAIKPEAEVSSTAGHGGRSGEVGETETLADHETGTVSACVSPWRC